jgi:hypothetical protein
MSGKGLSEDELRKRYPHLVKEIKSEPEEGKSIGVRVDSSQGYVPDVIDFLTRCDTENQAMEIIDYMERRGEVSKDYAASLKERLKEKGLRSFGKKRVAGHYFREFDTKTTP